MISLDQGLKPARSVVALWLLSLCYKMLSVLLESGNVNKKDEIVIYWSNFNNNSMQDSWTLLYPKPVTLFQELLDKKNKNTIWQTYFSCPAVSEKIKNTLVFKNPMSCSYKYNGSEIIQTTQNFLGVEVQRDPILDNGPIFFFSLAYLMFCEEDVDVSFTGPYFHKPEYMNYGSIIPGEFNIGSWFRPYVFEMQTWSKEGEIHLKEDEPLFYAEIKTNKKIVLKQFELNERLVSYANECVRSPLLFPRIPLSSRYKKFKNTSLNKKVLKEIKDNLID